ncbi:MAG: ThuA domain-containing protein [Chloroflexota bacterium]
MGRPSALLIMGGADYHNTPEHYEALAGLLAGPAGLNVTVTDDFVGQTAESLSTYDLLVLWATYTGDVPPEPVHALFEVVHSGTPLLILHGALYNFRRVSGWPEVIGTLILPRPIRHLPYQEVTVNIQDHSHPITAGVEHFRITDELFTLELRGEGVHLLASFDGRAANKPFSGRSESDEEQAASHAWRMRQPRAPLVYVKQHGAGTICGNALGHDAAALTNPGFRQLVVQGAGWLVS